MLEFFRKSKAAALEPLIELALSRHGYDRVQFLTELRHDAPTIAAMVEERLGDENPLPRSEQLNIRHRAGLGVALSHVSRSHASVSGR